MDNRIAIGVVVIAVLVIGGYLLYGAGPTVSAQGEAVLNVQPDEASVYLSVETRDDSAEIAKNMNNEITKVPMTPDLSADRNSFDFLERATLGIRIVLIANGTNVKT